MKTLIICKTRKIFNFQKFRKMAGRKFLKFLEILKKPSKNVNSEHDSIERPLIAGLLFNLSVQMLVNLYVIV